VFHDKEFSNSSDSRQLIPSSRPHMSQTRFLSLATTGNTMGNALTVQLAAERRLEEIWPGSGGS
jgi:hypothetical protein